MRKITAVILFAATTAAALAATNVAAEQPKGKWLSGDFHQHTLYTDGSTPFDFVMSKDNEFGLDWWANSEHGGARATDGNGKSWNSYVPDPIKGDYAATYGTPGVLMARWQSLAEYVYPDILRSRALYPDRRILSGFEWNVPAHEHCSTGIVADDAGALSAFEVQFDKSDADKSRIGEVTPYETLVKENKTHADAVAACGWMQRQYDAGTIDNAWIVFAHVERAGAWNPVKQSGGYNVESFRDFNTAGPDVCFGFEGAPGHQVNNTGRGGFGSGAVGGGTFGGVGVYTATVGGLWDALLGEGRHWFNFASSDYHTHWTVGGDDFYPGEYQKTYVFAVDDGDRERGGKRHPARHDGDDRGEYRRSLNAIADGLRSGNAFYAMGDLVDAFEFTARSKDAKTDMGGDLFVDRGRKGANVKLKIRFKSPAANHHGDAPVVDHVDLIAGDITGLVDPASPDYTKATNESAKVVASFNAGDWETDADGYNVITYHVQQLSKSTYFRVRGTNLACGVENETGPATTLPSAEYCNPLPDSLVATPTLADAADEAWRDLWFYGNPIFVHVQ